MSIFCDPKDEELLCRVLKCITEEVGAPNVIVTFPIHFKDHSPTGIGGQVTTLFHTELSIVIQSTMGHIFKVPVTSNH